MIDLLIWLDAHPVVKIGIAVGLVLGLIGLIVSLWWVSEDPPPKWVQERKPWEPPDNVAPIARRHGMVDSMAADDDRDPSHWGV